MEAHVYCAEITIARGKIEGIVVNRIKVERKGEAFAIPVGVGPKRGGSFVFLSAEAQRRLVREKFTISQRDGEKKLGERCFLTNAEVIIRGGKHLIVPSEEVMFNDHVLLLCHVESDWTKGRTRISSGTSTSVIAEGFRYRKPDSYQYASLGVIAEALTVLAPGQCITWQRHKAEHLDGEGIVTYDGRGKFSFGLGKVRTGTG